MKSNIEGFTWEQEWNVIIIYQYAIIIFKLFIYIEIIFINILIDEYY